MLECALTVKRMSDIQSIKRAFDILKAVGEQPDRCSLTAIATRLHLPKSTVSRMLSTLASLGAIEKLGGREGFRLGAELLALASNAPYPRNLAAIARPYLQHLAQSTGETVTLCVPDGDHAHYVDQINSSRSILITDWRRQKLPLHAASDGKLFLTQWSEEGLRRYLSCALQRYTATTLTTASALRKELKAIQKKGYSWTDGEYDDDIVGIAAPVRDGDDAIVASICVFGPRFRFPPENRAGALVTQTIKAAAAISARLKHAPVQKP